MNIAKLMKQAQRMQSEVTRVQQEVNQLEKSYSVGGGAVQVVARGDGTVKSVKISKDVVAAGDTESLEDMVLTAVNGALEEVKKEAGARMNAVTAGLNIPGMM